ncbi:MAG: alpha/beta hydrolase, partial [Pseudomonas sp.]|nr:alpha/beta hydrolase [Pseudomonas sp.]
MFNTKPLILALAIASPFFAASSQAADAKPSVVIVHGAFADGSDWAK